MLPVSRVHFQNDVSDEHAADMAPEDNIVYSSLRVPCQPLREPITRVFIVTAKEASLSRNYGAASVGSRNEYLFYQQS